MFGYVGVDEKTRKRDDEVKNPNAPSWSAEWYEELEDCTLYNKTMKCPKNKLEYLKLQYPYSYWFALPYKLRCYI